MSWDILGIGAVANLGDSPDAIFDALCASRRAARRCAFRRDRYRGGYAYEIDDRPADGRDEPLRATRWLTVAIRQALADAGLTEDLGQVRCSSARPCASSAAPSCGGARTPAVPGRPALRTRARRGLRHGAGAHLRQRLLGVARRARPRHRPARPGHGGHGRGRGQRLLTESAFGTLDRVQNDIRARCGRSTPRTPGC
ncbi:hypothetical protein NKH77_47955 [Streptomyces sp. M19]